MGRLGILGGTFDPVHLGHVHGALAVLREAALDKILFLPSASPPHKPGKATSLLHRLNMLTLQLEPYPSLVMSDLESRREGLSYTLDTMRLLKTAYPEHYLFFIIGEDILPLIHTWHQAGTLITENEFILMRRGEKALTAKDCPALTEQQFQKLTTHRAPTALVPVSGTWIRDTVAKDPKAVEPYLSPEVLTYIRRHCLYGTRGEEEKIFTTENTEHTERKPPAGEGEKKF